VTSKKAFHKKKTEQRAAACAEGKAQAEFTLAGCIAGHEQHDDVGERDEQHKANHGHEDAQRLAIFLIEPGSSWRRQSSGPAAFRPPWANRVRCRRQIERRAATVPQPATW